MSKPKPRSKSVAPVNVVRGLHPAFEPIPRTRGVKPPLPAALTRTGMTVYVHSDDLFSHWVRFVLAEKDMDGVHIEWVKPGQMLEDVTLLDPTHRIPLLAEREVILNAPRIIVEYLDERYPHPPMMPVEPAARARLRLALHRIEVDVLPLIETIQAGPAGAAQKARKALVESLLSGAAIFGAKNYFLSSDFSMVDALWAVLIWRLPSLGVPLPASAKIIERYADRLFARPAFSQALSPVERALR